MTPPNISELPHAIPQPPTPSEAALGRPTVDAHTLAAAVLGADKVCITGFGASRSPFARLWPHVRTVGAVESAQEAAEHAQAHRRLLRLATGLAFILTCAGGAGIGLGLGQRVGLESHAQAPALAPGGWAIEQIQRDGVLAANGSQRQLIPVGAPLPDGDLLLAAFPERGQYLTRRGLTMPSFAIGSADAPSQTNQPGSPAQ